MIVIRRLARLLRERVSVVFLGSALWWLAEHLIDKTLDRVLEGMRHLFKI